MPTSAERLAIEFQEELLDAHREAKIKCRYNATRFFQMLEEHGGVETARRLLATGTIAQTGLTELWKCQRLDLSVEAKVLYAEVRRLTATTPQLTRVGAAVVTSMTKNIPRIDANAYLRPGGAKSCLLSGSIKNILE
jgi:hypothetical protein